MVLVTGPTGSGKTNTLYSAISQLNTPETNIMTAEDPVEFNLAGRQPGPDEGGHRPQLRRSAEVVPAAGSEYRPRGRDSRLRDRGDRGQGRTDGPFGVVHAAHQRRPVHGEPPHEHGHRAFSRGDLGASHRCSASRPSRLRRVQSADGSSGAGAHRRRPSPPRKRRTSSRKKDAAAGLATIPATKAAWASTRFSSSPTR